MADIAELTEGTVADAEKALPDLSAADLAELREAEKAGKNRKTLLEAIDAELADRPAPKRDAAIEAAYNKGRHARKNGIGRGDCPFSAGEMRDAWREGWDFQDEV